MKKFHDEYQSFVILQTVTAEIGNSPNEVPDGFWCISFTHHLLLLNRCATIEERFFYMRQCSSEFWSVRHLEYNIKANLFKNQGRLPNNFSATLSPELKPSALEVFQDGYLGKGFCFIGNQYRLEVGGEEFFVDLCKEKNNTVVEFAVRTVDKAMGVATYRTTREMPTEMRGILPDRGN